MIRVVLPFHLRNLAGVHGDLELELPEPVTLRAVLDEIEKLYPTLRGTIRDHSTLHRPLFIRFFAGKEDLSNDPAENIFPAEVLKGTEPLLIVGAMAGG